MTYESASSFQIPEPYYTALFDAMPGNSVLVKNDEPKFTILAATPGYLKQAGHTKETLIGKNIFEAFPGNKNAPDYTEAADLHASYQHVLLHKKPHFMPVHRYDFRNDDGSFAEKYWRVSNKPVLTPEGEIAYIIHTADDVTDEVVAARSEHKIRGVEKTYSLFMQAPVAVCIVSGAEHHVELANEQMLQLLGRTKEMVGKPIGASLTEAKEQGLISVLNQVYATGQPYHTPVFPAELLINGERMKRYFDLVFQPYYQSSGDVQPASIFCIAYNITQQVLSQKKVEESEHRFRTLIEEASVATALYMGRDLVIQYANDIMIRYWGKDASVIGKPFPEAVPELKGQPFFGYLNEVYTTGEPYIGKEEKAYLEVNGKLQSFYFNFTYKALRDKEGSIYGIHHMAMDVTEHVVAKQQLEESAQELQLAIDAAHLGTYRIDLLIDQATFSQRVADWFGFPEQSLGLQVIQDYVHPEDRSLLISAFEATYLSEANSRHEVSYRVMHQKIGTVQHLRSFGKTFFNAEGKAYLMVGVIQNITQQMEYQQQLELSEAVLQRRVLERTVELEKLNEDLKRSNKNLESFAYAASHDLKEPIRKIHTFSERLYSSLSERLTEGEKHYFKRMKLASKRMGTLIDDLLMYSEVSQVTDLQELIDLNLIIDLVLTDLDLEVEEKGATIKVDKLFTIKGHPRQLQQAFQNLIGNALKYSNPEVAPVIVIRCSKVNGSSAAHLPLTPEELAQEYYQITIKDNGIGFAQEDADRIFNVFTRLHGMAEYNGTGVGLSIVRKVIESHNGHIWAESQPGEGAMFKILLPVD